MKFHLGFAALCLWATHGFLLAAEPAGKTLVVPRLEVAVTVDGQLDEACYAEHAPRTDFVNAADPAAHIPSTKAWVFWSEEQLTWDS